MSDQNRNETEQPQGPQRDPEDLSAEELRQGEIVLDTKAKRRRYLYIVVALIAVLAIGYLAAIPG